MAYENLKAAIKQAIKQNGNQEITGNLLQSTLLNIVNTLGTDYKFLGFASPSTVPPTSEEGRLLYFTTGHGDSYMNFPTSASGTYVTLEYGIYALTREANSKYWRSDVIVPIAQELGTALDKIMSQKAINTELSKKADKTDVDTELAKKADNEEMNRLLATKANTADVDTKFTEEKKRVEGELNKKANAADVASKFTEEAARVDGELNKKANAADVDSSLKELQNTVFPLQVSLSLDKTLLEYTGTEQTVKVSYSIKRKDALVIPSSLVLTINGMMKDIDIKSSDTVSVEVNKEGESMVVLTAKYDELIKSATAKVIMVLPIYFGFGTSEIDVAIADNKLEPRTSAVGIYEKTSTKDNVNFIILVPKTLTRLTSFTMGGAPCVMGESSVSISGKDYYMYKTVAVYMTGATLKVQAG